MAELSVNCDQESTRPPRAEMARLFDVAEETHDWETLKPWPMLLFYWQSKHHEDVLPIARWVSHFRLQTHKMCKRVNCRDDNYWIPEPPPMPQKPPETVKQLDLNSPAGTGGVTIPAGIPAKI